MATLHTGRIIPTTSHIGRFTSSGVINTVAPIITGIWNDAITWAETGKFWNDSGDTSGFGILVYTGRIIP